MPVSHRHLRMLPSKCCQARDMPDHVIVWDLETVPDIAGYAAANGLTGKSDEEIREALGNKFPKHIYHSIVCIGALVAHKEPDHWAVDAIGAPHVGERTEKQLISAFVDKIAELNPELVTFNGNTFDLPVLRYRAMIHAVSAPGLTARPYFNRYTEDALDLCDVLSSFAPHTKASLNELSRIMGLPGKPDGIDGAEVEQYFLDGKIKEIADYCENDVVNTYRVWLRYELFRGKLSDIAFQASEAEFKRIHQGSKQREAAFGCMVEVRAAPWFPDEKQSHIRTRLDVLIDHLVEDTHRVRLLFLTGDAGDGKTAFCATFARRLGFDGELRSEDRHRPVADHQGWLGGHRRRGAGRANGPRPYSSPQSPKAGATSCLGAANHFRNVALSIALFQCITQFSDASADLPQTTERTLKVSSFVVKASNDRPLVFVHYREGLGRRSLAKLLTRNAAADRGRHRQAAGVVAQGLAIGDFRNRTPNEYREFAAECYRWAAEAKTEAYQKMMEEMARPGAKWPKS